MPKWPNPVNQTRKPASRRGYNMTNNRYAIERQIENLISQMSCPELRKGVPLLELSGQLMVLREQLDSEGETYSLKELGEIFGLTMEQVRGVIMMGQVWRTQVTEQAKAAG
jgi:hypothetical protein